MRVVFRKGNTAGDLKVWFDTKMQLSPDATVWLWNPAQERAQQTEDKYTQQDWSRLGPLESAFIQGMIVRVRFSTDRREAIQDEQQEEAAGEDFWSSTEEKDVGNRTYVEEVHSVRTRRFLEWNPATQTHQMSEMVDEQRTRRGMHVVDRSGKPP